MNYGRAISIIFICISMNYSNATEIQPLIDIVSKAQQFATQQLYNSGNQDNLQITAGELDPRLRLAKCDVELEAFRPPGSRNMGNTTIGVRCVSPTPWSIYVPLRISIFEPVVVVDNSLRRGQVISLSDISVQEIDTAQIRGIPFSNVEQVIGSKTKNTLNQGTVIHTGNVCLVCKGDKVTITASASQIAVVMSGIALSDGSEGDAIRVQNSSSKRIIEAKVVDGSTVIVGS